MWVNPKYRDQQAPPPAAPEDTGRRLATFARGKDELRIAIDEFEGHPFISVRLWERSPDGVHWPSKKGISVRISEIADVIVALTEAQAIVTDTTTADTTRGATR